MRVSWIGFVVCLTSGLVVSGCVTTVQRDPALLAALASVSVREVAVTVAPVVETGVPAIDGVSAQRRIEVLSMRVDADLRATLLGLNGGAVPARLVVRLTAADIASDAGRALGASDSVVSGSVRLEGVADGRLIAYEPLVTSVDAAVHAGGNIGGAVSLIANLADALSNDRVAQASKRFAAAVKTWLISGQVTREEPPSAPFRAGRIGPNPPPIPRIAHPMR